MHIRTEGPEEAAAISALTTRAFETAAQASGTAQNLYGGGCMKKRAVIDWALEWMSTNSPICGQQLI